MLAAECKWEPEKLEHSQYNLEDLRPRLHFFQIVYHPLQIGLILDEIRVLLVAAFSQ